jgi:hypothetical protein
MRLRLYNGALLVALLVSVVTTVAAQTVEPGARGEVKADLTFRSRPNGFNFPNWGQGQNPQGNLTADDARCLFGDRVCKRVVGGRCEPTPAARMWIAEMNRAMDGGHCEGLAALSSAFHAGQRRPQDYGGQRAFDLQVSNGALLRMISTLFATQTLEPVVSATQRTTRLSMRQIVDTLTRAMQGKREFYTLGIYGEEGGHAITPYALEDLGSGRYLIHVYDNNFPGAANVVEVDTGADRWRYAAGALNPRERAEPWEGKRGSMDLTALSTRFQPLVCPFCSSPRKGTMCGGTATPAAAPAVSRPVAPSVASRPATPAVTRPATPAVAQPATPAVARPATPAVAQPATPAVARPATPAVAQPTTPAVARPAGPAVTRPAAPAATRPAIPAAPRPATPPVNRPATPAVTQPATPSIRPGAPRSPSPVLGPSSVQTTANCDQVMVLDRKSGKSIAVDAANTTSEFSGVIVTRRRGTRGCLVQLPAGTDYVLSIAGGKGEEKQPQTTTVFRPGQVVRLDVSLAAGQRDAIGISDSSFSYKPGANSRPNLTMGTDRPRGKDGYYEIANLALGGGHVFSMDERDDGRIVFDSDDPDLTTFDLSVQLEDEHGTQDVDFNHVDFDDQGQAILGPGDDGGLIFDMDTDSDGVIDQRDPDDDGDGRADAADADDDNDGILDAQETDIDDADGDGTADAADADDDNDGTPDVAEDDEDSEADDAADLEDAEDDGDHDLDDDGTLDEQDADDDNDGTVDEEDADDDGDGLSDEEDVDDDNDGTADDEDADDDGALEEADDADDEMIAEEQDDADHDADDDGTLDEADADDDNDGALDEADADDDNDGTLDEADADDDNDGTPDEEEQEEEEEEEPPPPLTVQS